MTPSANSIFERIAARPKLDPQPYSGWALAAAVRVDAAFPSFLSHTFHASNLKRQAIFLALAELDLNDPNDLASRPCPTALAECVTMFDPLAQIGRALIISKARDIVGAVFGSVPDGMVGILARIAGSEPLPNPGGYRDLFLLLSAPEHRERAKVLRQTEGKVSPSKLEILMRLEPPLVHSNVLACLFEAKAVDDLHYLLHVIRVSCSTATDEALRRSLDQIRSSTDLPKWGMRWLKKMDRLPPVTPPLPADDPDLVLVYGEGLTSLGRRLRNCAHSKIAHVAVGKHLYFEWTKPPGVVVELRRLSNGRWLMSDVLGKSNSRPPDEVAAAIRDKLTSHGVLTLAAPDRSRGLGGLARSLHIYDLQDDWSGLDDFEDDNDLGLSESDVTEAEYA